MQGLRELLQKTATQKPLRFSCSDIAGITGYHPWSDILELVDKYLYQDLVLLRDLDAAALGVEFVDVETQVEDILETKIMKKSEEGRKLYEKLQEIKKSVEENEQLLTSQEQTKVMLQRVQSLIENETIMKEVLSEDERKLILREYEGRVKTKYGIRCEEEALNKYEEITGFPVTKRNDQFYILEVMPFITDGYDESGTGSIDSEDSGDDDDNVGDTQGNTDTQWQKSKNNKRPKGTTKKIHSQDIDKNQASITSFLRPQTEIQNSQQVGETHATSSSSSQVKDTTKSKASKQSLVEAWTKVKSTPTVIDLCDSSDDESPIADKGVSVDSDEKNSTVPLMITEVHSSMTSEDSQISLPSAVLGMMIGEDNINAKHSQIDATEGVQLVDNTKGTENIVATVLSTDTSAIEQKSTRRKGKKRRKQRPSFLLIGKIDGMSEHINCESDDYNDWKAYKVVVEMKNRVNKLSNPPPLYDQIQLVSYMLMTGSTCGDLVQAIPNKVVQENAFTSVGEEAVQGTCSGTSSGSSSSLSTNNFLICRVELDGPPYYHKHHWDTVIIPRLHVFNDMIILFRKDDSLRYSFLLASENEKLAIIASLCPYVSL